MITRIFEIEMIPCALDLNDHINESEASIGVDSNEVEVEKTDVNIEQVSEIILTQEMTVVDENVVTVITEEPISDNVTEMTLVEEPINDNMTDMTLIANQVSIDTTTVVCNLIYTNLFYLNLHIQLNLIKFE